MVQFSLKLEDNRVDKWSAHYLDYRSFKQSIKALVRLRDLANQDAIRRAAGKQPGVLQPVIDGTVSRASEATGLLSSPGDQDVQHGSPGKAESSYAKRVEAFENLLKEEICKMERFFLDKIEKNKRELGNLYATVPTECIVGAGSTHGYQETDDSCGRQSVEPRVFRAPQSLSRREEESLKRVLLDVYRNLTLLQNFAIVNYTAVVKITKKYDKQVVGTAEEHWPGVTLPPATSLTDKMLDFVNKQDFYRTTKLKEVIAECENFFAGMFCGGDEAQARGLMLPQKTDERIDLAQFQLGYRMGMAAVLAFWIIWDCCFEPHEKDPNQTAAEHAKEAHQWKVSVLLHPAFPVYRAVAGILLLRWCWGLSTLVWGRTRINYIYLFDMVPRAVSSPLEVFNNVAVETVVYLANLLIYYKMLMHRFPPILPAGCLPLMLCVYVMFQVVFPLRKSWEFWRVIFRVLVAPLTKVEFFATYVADVMTSSVKTTQDIAWTVCFFLSGDFLLDLEEYHSKGCSWQKSSVYANLVIPALCILPLCCRFLQCLNRYSNTQKRFPHLANCLKYCMTFTVVLFGVFSPPHSTTTAVKIGWFVLYVVSTLYTIAWDVFQDWGLGNPSEGFLRKKRLFSRSSVYYAAVVVDLILRFNWLYSLIPPGHNPLPFIHSSTLPVFVTTVVIVCEFLRRTMWGFFRVENEHLNNTEGYRSTDHVPLHFTTTTVRPNEPRKQGLVVIGEVVGVTAAGIAMAAISIMVAKDQMDKTP